MARIQVLPLTQESLGSAERTRFALVIDQADDDVCQEDAAVLELFREKCGAV